MSEVSKAEGNKRQTNTGPDEREYQRIQFHASREVVVNERVGDSRPDPVSHFAPCLLTSAPSLSGRAVVGNLVCVREPFVGVQPT